MQEAANKTSKSDVRKGSLLIWGVSDSLRGRFKAACAVRGVSMRDAIVDLMEGYIKQPYRKEAKQAEGPSQQT